MTSPRELTVAGALIDAVVELLRRPGVPESVAEQLDASAVALRAPVVTVVAGRRGAGAGDVVAALAGVAPPGPEPTEVRATSISGDPPWYVVHAPAPTLGHPVRKRGHLDTIESPGLLAAADVVVVVASAGVRSDDVQTLEWANAGNALPAASLVLCVVAPVPEALHDVRVRPVWGQTCAVDPRPDGRDDDPWLGAVRAEGLARHYVVGRRCADALEAAGRLAAGAPDAWAVRMRNELEAFLLSPAALLAREVRDLDLVTSSAVALDEGLRRELLDIYLGRWTDPFCPRPVESAELLLDRTRRWRAEGTRLAPRAAAVARTVMATTQSRLAMLHPDRGADDGRV